MNITINNEKHYISFNKLNNDVINMFTLKPYNFRSGFVSDDEIITNYNNIQRDLNHSFNKIVKPIQTHTNIVKKVDINTINDEFNDVDGLVTNMKNVALVTTLADCQGILLYDSKNKVIGNIHSGWKGTLNRIIENAINLMISDYNCEPQNIEVYICPSILSCCFEVDSDVKEMFESKFNDIDIKSCITLGEIKDNKQKYFIDTVSINKQVLLNMGLKENNIISADFCSKCNHEIIYSHRADGPECGRNIALICLKP